MNYASQSRVGISVSCYLLGAKIDFRSDAGNNQSSLGTPFFDKGNRL